MKVILFTHPDFLESFSMTRFSAMIADYLEAQKIEYEIWSPKASIRKISPNSKLSKWLGYIDQYLIFPVIVRWRLRSQPKDTVFVFCDQALGPWVPLVAHRPHVIYCHDILAIKSALGVIPQNPVSFSGRMYQRFIRRGLEKGGMIVCSSKRTKSDIIKYMNINHKRLKVVYNGLNYPFARVVRDKAFKKLSDGGLLHYDRGCILHVGGGQWYKNTEGVLQLYVEYCHRVEKPKPLLMVSPSPSESAQKILDRLPLQGQVSFIQGINSELLEALYSYADVLLFPSIAEGFGWPIVEAQACGCPVITTNDTPMNEVGGSVATYLNPVTESTKSLWLHDGVEQMLRLLSLSNQEKYTLSLRSISWAKNFNADKKLSLYVKIYRSVGSDRDELTNVYDG